jgi:hypothetical protein
MLKFIFDSIFDVMFKLEFSRLCFGGLMAQSNDWREYAKKRFDEIMAQRRFAVKKRGLDWARTAKEVLLMSVIYEIGEKLDMLGITGGHRINYFNVARMVFKRAWLMGVDKIDEIYAYVRATKPWFKNCDPELADEVVKIVRNALSENLPKVA